MSTILCLCGRGEKSVAVQACGGYLWVCADCATEWEQAKAQRAGLLAQGVHPKLADRITVAGAKPRGEGEP